ncbi:GNAT family N-acetyltransferase [Sedimentibacter sp. zth1]|uniref:GNAT family N-acetyltransferase n=1 Tax=Sedimentibacter sp. zth1 TaxID=2816908 RepID=UPI001A92E25C|nr:GNAT family N-acetyltransferase [Sedimentibacter sp. zth1]QSX06277.1 GNAT family N-acetyltransferase [Sedimentibacter sp. zth1]
MIESICLATIQDVERIALIHTESWKVAYKNIIPTDKLEEMTKIEPRTKMWAKLLTEYKDSTYVYKLNDEIIGYFTIGKSRDSDLQDAYELIGIYFHPDFYGRGYGNKMMEFLMENVKHRGFNKIFLWVFKENERAIRYYKKFGFEFDENEKIHDLGRKVLEQRYLAYI